MVLLIAQRIVSLVGILIILIGVMNALVSFAKNGFLNTGSASQNSINDIRLHLGRTLILGLEFIVAADLIGTTTTPDYYAVGLLAIIVIVRTILTFSISREINMLNKGEL